MLVYTNLETEVFKFLLGQDMLNCIQTHPTLQFFPSYGRKPGLFGLVVSDFHEA